MENIRKGRHLIFEGYAYRQKKVYKNTVNWVCASSNVRDSDTDKFKSCLARCVTNTNGEIKFGKNEHNHLPKYTQYQRRTIEKS